MPGYKISVLRSPKHVLISLPQSQSEMTGPSFSVDERGPLDNDLILNYAQDGLPIGERIRVHSRMFDQNGQPMAGTLVECWQANAGGRYTHPADAQDTSTVPRVRGWGRACSDFESGVWHFETIKPGRPIAHDGKPAAPISMGGSSRAASISVCTRASISATKPKPTLMI